MRKDPLDLLRWYMNLLLQHGASISAMQSTSTCASSLILKVHICKTLQTVASQTTSSPTIHVIVGLRRSWMSWIAAGLNVLFISSKFGWFLLVGNEAGVYSWPSTTSAKVKCSVWIVSRRSIHLRNSLICCVSINLGATCRLRRICRLITSWEAAKKILWVGREVEIQRRLQWRRWRNWRRRMQWWCSVRAAVACAMWWNAFSAAWASVPLCTSLTSCKAGVAPMISKRPSCAWWASRRRRRRCRRSLLEESC